MDYKNPSIKILMVLAMFGFVLSQAFALGSIDVNLNAINGVINNSLIFGDQVFAGLVQQAVTVGVILAITLVVGLLLVLISRLFRLIVSLIGNVGRLSRPGNGS